MSSSSIVTIDSLSTFIEFVLNAEENKEQDSNYYIEVSQNSTS